MRRCFWLILVCLFGFISVCGDVVSGKSNMEALVPKETPDGWALRSTPQIFTKETLYEHIDGQADLFLKYGFEGSIFAVYQNENSSRERIDLDIYDMGETVQAFGIFSRFRRDDQSAGIGLDSYVDDRYALFYKGKYFVVLRATEASPSSLKQLARIVESRMIDNSLPPKELGYFPRSGLKPGSIEYYPQGLMGRSFLKRGFKATYVVQDNTEATTEDASQTPDSNLFIAIFDSPEEAEGALRKLKEDLPENGAAQVAIGLPPGFEPVKGEDAYQGKLIIVRKGRHLAGAAGFEREKDAGSLLSELVKQIE